jgi:hypothetical protein
VTVPRDDAAVQAYAAKAEQFLVEVDAELSAVRSLCHAV